MPHKGEQVGGHFKHFACDYYILTQACSISIPMAPIALPQETEEREKTMALIVMQQEFAHLYHLYSKDLYDLSCKHSGKLLECTPEVMLHPPQTLLSQGAAIKISGHLLI